MLNWGILSTGRIADKFCHDMAYVKNGKLSAVAARSQNDADEFSAKHRIPKAYKGYQALFADREIDIIYVATPHNFHYQHVYQALSAGKHVLCEKPITVSSREFRQLSALAKEKSLFLMEAMWTYFLPALNMAKRWIAEGRIGTLKHIKADFGYQVPYEPEGRMYNPALAGGCLYDMGIYPLALAQFFNPGELEELVVHAQFAPLNIEDDVEIMSSCNGVRLTLATSFQCLMQNAAFIIGDVGYIKIPNFWCAKSCVLYQLDGKIDEFVDTSPGEGYHFEAQAVGKAVASQLHEHAVMPHAKSLLLQRQLETIRSQF